MFIPLVKRFILPASRRATPIRIPRIRPAFLSEVSMNHLYALLGRIGLSLIFIASGWSKLAGYLATQQYMEAMGVSPQRFAQVTGLVVNGIAWWNAEKLVPWQVANNGRLPLAATYRQDATTPTLELSQDVRGEVRNDVAVQHLEAQVVLQPRLVKQHHRLGVHHQRLAVHVGHVGKCALGRGQRLVVPPGHQLLGQGQCLGILCKRQRRAAMDVARELVEHHDLGQPPLRRGAPLPQLAMLRRLPDGPKTHADHGVDRVFLGKVLRGREFFEPEMKDVFGLHGNGLCVKNGSSA